MAKKCTKKRDARAKLLFCQSKPITFCRCRRRRRRRRRRRHRRSRFYEFTGTINQNARTILVIL